MMMALGGTGYVIFAKDGLMNRFPESITSLLKVMKERNYGYKTGCYNDYETEGYITCKRKISNVRKPSIVVWGDSHAANLMLGLDKYYGERFNIVQRTSSGCSAVGAHDGRPHPEVCLKNNELALNEIIKEKPFGVILSGRWEKYPYKNIEGVINRLKENGIERITLIGPFILFKKSLPQYLLRKYRETGLMPSVIKSDEDRFLNIDKEMSQIAGKLKVHYISPYSLLCTEQGCRVRADDSFDSVIGADRIGHLTNAGSEYLVGKMKAELDKNFR